MMIMQKDSHYPPDKTRNAYEDLRANALGKSNRASGLALFLRDGMSAWLKIMQNIIKTQCKTRPVMTTGFYESEVSEAHLASILIDIILTAKPAEFPGGKQ